MGWRGTALPRVMCRRRYTGHVTAGGSICIEVLTQTGSPHCWSSSMCFESVINTVILNMCERFFPLEAAGVGRRWPIATPDGCPRKGGLSP